MRGASLILMALLVGQGENPEVVTLKAKVCEIRPNSRDIRVASVKKPEVEIWLKVSPSATLRDMHGETTLEEAEKKMGQGQELFAIMTVKKGQRPITITEVTFDPWSGKHAIMGKVTSIDTKLQQITIESPAKRVLSVAEYSELMLEEKKIDIKDLRTDANLEVIAIVQGSRPEERDGKFRHFTILSAVFRCGLRPRSPKEVTPN
jgi:hypothetical protein